MGGGSEAHANKDLMNANNQGILVDVKAIFMPLNSSHIYESISIARASVRVRLQVYDSHGRINKNYSCLGSF